MSYSFDPNRDQRAGTGGSGGYGSGYGANYGQGYGQEDEQETAAYPQQPSYPGQGYGRQSYPQPGTFPGATSGDSQPLKPAQPSYTPQAYSQGYPQASGLEAPTAPGTPVYVPPERRSWLPYLVVGVVVVVLVCCVLPGAILLRNQGGQTTAQSTPAPGQVVYQSALTAVDPKWPNGNGCTFQSDGYHITNNATCIARLDTPADASIAVNVVQASGATNLPHGIALRRTSANDYYVFGITSAGMWTFVKYGDNAAPQSLVGFTGSSTIKTGLNVTNAIEVRAKGSHFDFYVNGTKVGQHDDGSYGSGLPGLTGDSDATIIYTTFKLAKLV